MGYENVQAPEAADVLVVNTCGFSAGAEAESLDTVVRLARKFPDKRLIVSGCLPAIAPGALEAVFKGPTAGAGDVAALGKLLGARNEAPAPPVPPPPRADQEDLSSTRIENRLLLRVAPWYFALERRTGGLRQPLHNVVKTAAFDARFRAIVVARGCSGTCTYCAVRTARGALQSKPLEAIVQELRAGLEAGDRDFWLVADDVGCWGQDLGLDAADLLEAILGEPASFRLVINYLEPAWFLRLHDRLEPLLADPRVVNVNIPLQSGSAAVVQRMGRHYLPGLVVRALERLRRHAPDLVLKTHLMVGFPGESREDFRRTLAMVPHFHLVVPFAFTPRPGTPAATFPGRVPEQEKARRFRVLQAAVVLRYTQLVARAFVARPGGVSTRT